MQVKMRFLSERMKSVLKNCVYLFAFFVTIVANTAQANTVFLSHGTDKSAGNLNAYIITTPLATYYLEKQGGGLSSVLDKDGIDWLGFHPKKGSGHKGEYRGFPNAVHKQDGNYFHALMASTDHSTSIVEVEKLDHVRIVFTSSNKKWQGQWDFYPDRSDFTMTKVSSGYKYWVLYEGIPGGKMANSGFWYASTDNQAHNIFEQRLGDLPAPEWTAFGDSNTERMLYLLHHQDDDIADDYVSRPDMTVMGFGRHNKEKYFTTPQTFSIGFIESTSYRDVVSKIQQIINSEQ